MTLLDFAREHKRTQMCEQLEMLAKGEVNDQSGICDNKNEDVYEVEENELVESIVSCLSLKNQAVANNSEKNDTEKEYSMKKTVSDFSCSSDEKKESNDKNDDSYEVKDSDNATVKACWQCGIYGRYKCVGCRKARY